MAASGKLRNEIRTLEAAQKEEYSPERQDRIEFLAVCLDDAEMEEREMREMDREPF